MPDFALPDFIRETRSVGAPSAPHSDHARLMRPLLTAWQAAQEARTIEAQCEAFQAVALEQAWRDLISAFATERHPDSMPDQRALVAELTVSSRWARVAAAEQDAVAAEARARWIEALSALFTAVDRWWGAIVPILAESAGRRGAFWRRVLQRSA